MPLSNRFRKSDIDTLAKRAAYLCSNPDCNVPTIGPTVDITRSVTIGECAHIHGAEEGSARYVSSMTLADRAHIINAIWLCRNCHKEVDADPVTYPAQLLFEWKRNHEAEMARRIGKAGTSLKAFEKESLLTRQIIIGKPDGWEYMLTAELLKVKLAPIISRWQSLADGLYAKTTIRIPKRDSLTWFEDQFRNLKQQVIALNLVVNREFTIAFGESGLPGSETAILRACNLFVEGCQRLLEWEESIQFSLPDKAFRKLSELMKAIGGYVLQQFAVIPDKLTSGAQEINITISFPERWVSECSREIKMIKC